MLCHAMLCHATVNLWALTLFHTHVCSTTTNPSEELALDSGIEHESHCMLPCLPNGTVLCHHELPGSFCLDVTMFVGLVLLKLGV